LAENAKPVSIKEETTVTGPVERGGLILVVDDEDTVRNMASAMLKRKLGYDVVTARDGFQALEVFSAREDEFSLVILDLSMPGMNGWQTLAALRKIRPGLPVILSSGYDEAQVCRGEHEERPHAFLPKPYGAKELKATLDAALK
jgi:CheY-like chemotaxis protein